MPEPRRRRDKKRAATPRGLLAYAEPYDTRRAATTNGQPWHGLVLHFADGSSVSVNFAEPPYDAAARLRGVLFGRSDA